MVKQIIVIPFLKPAGMALYPFILINHNSLLADEVLIRHESIHLKQQLELLILPFYILYRLSYLVNLLIFRNHQQAYMGIAFEREAYQHETDPCYLQNRKLWSWSKYLR